MLTSGITMLGSLYERSTILLLSVFFISCSKRKTETDYNPSVLILRQKPLKLYQGPIVFQVMGLTYYYVRRCDD